MYWYRLLVLHGPHIVTKFIELCCLGYRTNWTETYTCTYIVLKWLIDHIISQINCTSISEQLCFPQVSMHSLRL